MEPRIIWTCGDRQVHRYAFDLPMAPEAWYAVDDVRYRINTALEGDLRIAYVSCNGQEFGDRRRSRTERNVLWRRLARQHETHPFQLLLHGGDQIYADELVNVHPGLREWSGIVHPRHRVHLPDVPKDLVPALRGAFFDRYVAVLTQTDIAWLMARVPSLAMWDDHDICDGWGSIPPARLDSPVGRALFTVAREHFMIFQIGAAPDEVPEICRDRSGTSLSWHVRLPELDLIAPDLRSERRPSRAMGEHGRAALDASLSSVRDGRVLLLSSVPALGPRLSWVEAVLHLLPGMQKYEDDLRDQWQSRAHREEWRAFLERLAVVHGRGKSPITVLSGEIHLATRGVLEMAPTPLHQLVSSGIAHPAPPAAYALALGALARFGKSPIPRHSLRMCPLPGRRAIYTAERNYLVLERQGRAWRAWWELEDSGATPPLDI